MTAATVLQGRTREQLAASQVEADSWKSQTEVAQAKLQRAERSNAHLRKQRAQMMPDLQVSRAVHAQDVHACFLVLRQSFLGWVQKLETASLITLRPRPIASSTCL